MMIKRLSAIVLTVALCVVMALPAFAAQPTISVSSASANENDLVTLKISLKNNPGIASMKLTLDYDRDVLEFQEASVAQDIKNVGGSLASAAENDGELIINWLSLSSNEYAVDGDFAEVKFRVKSGAAAGASDISVKYNENDVYNKNENNVKFSVENGNVKVNKTESQSPQSSASSQSSGSSQIQSGSQSSGTGSEKNGTSGNGENHSGESRGSQNSAPTSSKSGNGSCEHVWESGVTLKKPTCTEEGECVYTCGICGISETGTIPALGHKFGEWEIVKAATATENGERKHTCNFCGFTETEQYGLTNDPETAAGEEENTVPTAGKQSKTDERSGLSVVVIAVVLASAVAIGGATILSARKK